MQLQALCITSYSSVDSNWSYSPETPNSGQSRRFFCPVRHWNLKDMGDALLCYFMLFTSLHSHLWIQTGVTVQKGPIWVTIGDFLSCVTLKFDGWLWKTTGHLFYATLSFLHHSIGVFKLELRSGNAQIDANLRWLLWPWHLTSDLVLSHGHLVCQW